MHSVDLDESFPTSVYLQKLASIHPRTSPKKFVSSSAREFEFELWNFEPLICSPVLALRKIPLPQKAKRYQILNDITKRNCHPLEKRRKYYLPYLVWIDAEGPKTGRTACFRVPRRCVGSPRRPPRRGGPGAGARCGRRACARAWVERFDRRMTEPFKPFEPFEFFQNRKFPELFLR